MVVVLSKNRESQFTVKTSLTMGTEEQSRVRVQKEERNLSSNLSHQLGVDFGDAIDGARSLHTEIGRRVAGRSGAEGTDGAGDKESQAVLRCDVQDVVKP